LDIDITYIPRPDISHTNSDSIKRVQSDNEIDGIIHPKVQWFFIVNDIATHGCSAVRPYIQIPIHPSIEISEKAIF
jgi:hypothetical protein